MRGGVGAGNARAETPGGDSRRRFRPDFIGGNSGGGDFGSRRRRFPAAIPAFTVTTDSAAACTRTRAQAAPAGGSPPRATRPPPPARAAAVAAEEEAAAAARVAGAAGLRGTSTRRRQSRPRWSCFGWRCARAILFPLRSSPGALPLQLILELEERHQLEKSRKGGQGRETRWRGGEAETVAAIEI
jgi:hypothetical protein